MLSLSSQVRISSARDPVDMRKSFPGLIGLTESVLREAPLSGHLFVFISCAISRKGRCSSWKNWAVLA